LKGTLKIGRMFRVPVFVHWSFSLLFLYIAYMGFTENHSWEYISTMSFYIICTFCCVLLHEFGHVLSARYFGIGTQDVIILPIGGLARLNKIPEKPIQELIVAIAGPLVNVVLCILFVLALVFGYGAEIQFSELFLDNPPHDLLFEINKSATFLLLMAKANFILMLFNLIPAFPMDGGRVFRALMSMQFSRTKATLIASVLGQICAVGFLLYAITPLLKDVFSPDSWLEKYLTSKQDWTFQPVLAFVSFFIFNAARNEYKYVRMDEIMSRHTIANVLRTQFTRLHTIDLMQTPILEMRKGYESSFLVFGDDEILRGVLQDDDIMVAAKNNDQDALVLTYMTKDFEKTVPYESIKTVYYKMLETHQYLMPVMNDDEVLGVVDMHQLQNFIASHDKVY
jgi:Zn-dependent protease/CBS domain-containing protein